MFAWMDREWKPEIARQAGGDLLPGIACIGAAIDTAVVLLEKQSRHRRREQQLVNALAVFWILLRHELRARPAVLRAPCRAAIVGAKDADRRDADEHPLRVRRVELDRVQAEPAGSGMPMFSRRMRAQAGHFTPCFSCVIAAKKRSRGDARIEHLRLGRAARLEMPDAVERKPGALRESGPAFRGCPSLPEVVRMNDLRSKPSVVGCGEDASGAPIANGVMDFLPAQKWAASFPTLPVCAGEKE